MAADKNITVNFWDQCQIRKRQMEYQPYAWDHIRKDASAGPWPEKSADYVPRAAASNDAREDMAGYLIFVDWSDVFTSQETHVPPGRGQGFILTGIVFPWELFSYVAGGARRRRMVVFF